MKRKYLIELKLKQFLVIAMLFFAAISFGQQEKEFSDQFIRDAIVEVFQDNADELVFNSSSIRYSFITSLLKNQIRIEYHPDFVGKEFVSTNSLPLQNKYNKGMQRDAVYNENTFNPLKYQFKTNPIKKTFYRIADSDYLMIVYPSKN